MHSRIRISVSLLPASAVLLVACTSNPPEKPNNALATAQQAITLANREVTQKAQSVPLYEAEKKLNQARSIIGNPDATEEDYARARRLAEEATLDARLAQAQAAAYQAQARKIELGETLETLRENLQLEGAE
ncbi:MAG: DUF4398 domain-containing protein [Nitrococcus sp.]|nr:DUF4398 domain-containing protein [Nitrococcus sp.]